jgi:small subunit ribosomal protein S13
MAIRISGVNLPDQKRIEIALMSIYGIGRSVSQRILDDLKIDRDTKARDLTPGEEGKLREYIEKKLSVEGELRREISMNIKHQKDVNSYKGVRHQRHLPLRGQRTKTNSRTVRGNVRRTAGSGRKTTSEKT